jgi:hypothetical protein
MLGTVLGISEIKTKPTKWNTTEQYRYIAIVNEKTGQQYLVRMLTHNFDRIIVDAEGDEAQVRSGSIVDIDHYYEGKFVLDDGKKMLFNPKIFTVMGHVTKESTQKYLLEDISFYDWGVILKNKNSKAVLGAENWNRLTNMETSNLLWKLKKKLKVEQLKEAYVEITTTFEVYYGWNLNREWLYHRNGGMEWRLTSENLQPMRKVVLEEEEIRKTRMVLEEIKLILQRKMFVSWDDILALARKFTIPEDEVQEYAKNAVWKKGYDEEFTDFLNEKSKQVLYGADGIFYILPGGLTILEDPQPNKATYIFIGQPDFIASKIEAIKREQRDTNAWRELLYRAKKATPEKVSWFVGRIYHLDTDQWKRDLENILEEVVDSE